MDVIRNSLGRNIIVADGLSVGVAWTSVRISHEPPAPQPEDESPSPPTPDLNGTRGGGDIAPPGFPDSTAAVATGNARRRPRSRKQKTGTKRGSSEGGKGGKEERSTRQKEELLPVRRKRRKKGVDRDGGGGGGDGGGDDSGGGGRGRAEARRARRSGQDEMGGAERQQQRRRRRRRPKSTGALPARKKTHKRAKARGGAVTGQSSGEEVRTFYTHIRAKHRTDFRAIQTPGENENNNARRE